MGDADIASTLDAGQAGRSWRARVGLLYGYAFADRYFSHAEEVDNYDKFEMTLHLFSVAANLDAPTGTGLSALLPYADLHHENWLGQTDQQDLSDAEVRLRQDLGVLPWLQALPRMTLALGAVLPTGPYIAKKEAGFGFEGQTVAEVNKELSLGRGAYWLAADLDVAGSPLPDLAVFGSVATRTAVTDAVDGFSWGPELRLGAGARYALFGGKLAAIVSGEVQRRGESTEIVQGERKKFANVGGTWVNVTPTLQGQIASWLGASVSLRVPLWRDVYGIQATQGPSVYVSLSGTVGLGGDERPVAARPAGTQVGEAPQTAQVAALLVPGKTTLVDYWATWCEPCLRLGPQLEAFAADRADVAVRKVDASDWDQAQWSQYLPAVGGLPVVEVYGPDGMLRQRLEGDAAFEFAAAVPMADAATATGP